MGIKYKVLVVLILCFFLSSCGYKPLNVYAKNEIDSKVFVNLFVDLQDPQNAVIVKDSINKLLVQKLDTNLVYEKNLADVILDLKIKSVDMKELQYDSSGYIKLYRAKVGIKIAYFNVQRRKGNDFLVDGEYDFSIDDGLSLSDSKRFEAIKEASNNALNEILSKIAILSVKQ